MTREEAIKELKIEYIGDTEAIRDAKDMAIDCFEQFIAEGGLYEVYTMGGDTEPYKKSDTNGEKP